MAKHIPQGAQAQPVGTEQVHLVDPKVMRVNWDDESQEIIDFGDLAPWSKKVRIGKDIFTVREASAEAGAKYRNKAAQAAKLNDAGKVVGVDNPADVEPYLVHLCLFYDKQNKPGDPAGGTTEANVPLDRVKSWKYSIVKQLFDRIVKVSGLREDEEDEVFLQKRIDEDTQKLKQLRNGKQENPDRPVGNDAKN